jgi:hypothetical protein
MNAPQLDLEHQTGIVGTLVQNGGGETLLIPEKDLREIDRIGRELRAEEVKCAGCGNPFVPRKGSGGREQKFCSTGCRSTHRQRGNTRPANNPNMPPNVAEGPFVAQHGSHAAKIMGLADEAADTFEPNVCWGVPAQLAIECSRPDKDHVLIQQLADHPEENVSILIARANAVCVARSILYAAGFRAITIAKSNNGFGWEDVEDGELP